MHLYYFCYLAMYARNLFYYIYSVQLLLGYLPTDRGLWPYELEKKRNQYSAYNEEFLLNPVSYSCQSLSIKQGRSITPSYLCTHYIRATSRAVVKICLLFVKAIGVFVLSGKKNQECTQSMKSQLVI